MPNYRYDICHGDEVLHRMEFSLPVSERDNVTVRRVKVPESVSVVGSAISPDADAGGQIKRYLHRLEEKIGNNREFQKRIEFSPEVIKKANNLPS